MLVLSGYVFFAAGVAYKFQLSACNVFIDGFAAYEKRLFAREVPVAPLRRAVVVSLTHDKLLLKSEPGAFALFQDLNAAAHGHSLFIVAAFLVKEQAYRNIADFLFGLDFVGKIAYGAGQKLKIARIERRNQKLTLRTNSGAENA